MFDVYFMDFFSPFNRWIDNIIDSPFNKKGEQNADLGRMPKVRSSLARAVEKNTSENGGAFLFAEKFFQAFLLFNFFRGVVWPEINLILVFRIKFFFPLFQFFPFRSFLSDGY